MGRASKIRAMLMDDTDNQPPQVNEDHGHATGETDTFKADDDHTGAATSGQGLNVPANHDWEDIRSQVSKLHPIKQTLTESERFNPHTSHNPASRSIASALLNIQDTATAESEELKQQLAAGQRIIELDPAEIEPSFIADRIDDNQDIEALAELIEREGQLIPILVRPHPDKPGFYQTSFGHRRRKACMLLGRKVRAIVRSLTDDELIIAQGQENNARLDLSFIERATFAGRILERGASRNVVAQALAVKNRSQITSYLRVFNQIPKEVIQAIGPAPSIGRRRWEILGDLIASSEALTTIALRTIEATGFPETTSDDRFEEVMKALTHRERQPAEPALVITSPTGAQLVKCVVKGNSALVRIDRTIDPEFSDFIFARMQSLYDEYTRAN